MRKFCPILLVLLGLYLGLYHGQVALWETNNPQPVKIFPYRAESYPRIDQQTLEKGIPIVDENHLSNLLEDFTS